MDKVIRSFIVLFVLLIAITGYHKSYDQSHNASTINNLKENIFLQLEYDDGQVVYEEIAIYDNIEYEFIINTGARNILEWVINK